MSDQCAEASATRRESVLGGSTMASDVKGFTNAVMTGRQEAAMPPTSAAASALGISISFADNKNIRCFD